ncbi:MAG: sigma factor-like helix-turn-helix DNA-binding protein, partial [Oscillospiraceae bacterium]|nr:sigma factor-like helix-turn-helix DNA-binding protein [Oscillospiraceae bacterium]
NEMKRYYRFKSLHKSDIPVFSKTEDDVEFEALEALLVQELPEYRDIDVQKIWEYIKERDTLTFKIFVLYFYYDEKLSNIAKTLNIGESTVKNRLYRTINQMRERF